MRDHGNSPGRVMLALSAVPVGAWIAGFMACALVGVPPRLTFAIANYTAIAGIAPGLMIGLAAHALLRTFGFHRWRAFAAMGMLFGSGLVLLVLGFVAFAFEGVAWVRVLPAAILIAILFGGVPGLGAALAFRAMLRLGRSRPGVEAD